MIICNGCGREEKICDVMPCLARELIIHKPEKVRTVRFAPYVKGPRFTLHLYDVHEIDEAGRYGVGFVLKIGRKVIFSELNPARVAYGHHSVDGDAAVRNVMGWLTLRPGDTDSDYFTDYTQEQLDFASAHAETLACEVVARFGEE